MAGVDGLKVAEEGDIVESEGCSTCLSARGVMRSLCSVSRDAVVQEDTERSKRVGQREKGVRLETRRSQSVLVVPMFPEIRRPQLAHCPAWAHLLVNGEGGILLHYQFIFLSDVLSSMLAPQWHILQDRKRPT